MSTDLKHFGTDLTDCEFCIEKHSAFVCLASTDKNEEEEEQVEEEVETDLLETRMANEETEVDGIDMRHIYWRIVVVGFVTFGNQSGRIQR